MYSNPIISKVTKMWHLIRDGYVLTNTFYFMLDSSKHTAMNFTGLDHLFSSKLFLLVYIFNFTLFLNIQHFHILLMTQKKLKYHGRLDTKLDRWMSMFSKINPTTHQTSGCIIIMSHQAMWIYSASIPARETTTCSLV